MTDSPLPNSSGQSLFDAVQPGSMSVAILLIQDAIRMGQADLALELSALARNRWGDDPGLRLVEGMLMTRLRRFPEAERQLKLAADANAGGPVSEMAEAMLAIEMQQHAKARAHLRAVIRRCPDYPGVAGTLASLLMPGPNYRDVLSAIHRQLRPKGYLEVGVETGATLSLASSERVIGIDPNFAPLRRDRIKTDARLFEMTSQDFFERQSRAAVLGEVPLDLAFVDGLHRYRAALSDFAAIERWAHPNTVVVMHDALPIAPVYAEANRRTRFWVGDVWKAVFVLLNCRQDLRIRIVPTPPSGLVVVRWRQPSPRMGEAMPPWQAPEIDFPALGESEPVWPSEFPLVTNDAQGYAEALFG